MRVLVTGAGGFMGGYIVAALGRARHEVVACVRRPAAFRRQWPTLRAIVCDFRCDTDPSVWRLRLEGVDAVINAAGVLAARPAVHRAVHHKTPRALFQACETAGVRRVVQVSALGAREDAPTAYAASKAAGDADLMARGLDWVVLRPSILYAPGAYGGTALFRGLSALPWVVPVPRDGRQKIQPAHMDDFTDAVCRSLDMDEPARRVIEVVGPEPVALRDLFLAYRAWLGIAGGAVLPVPMALCRGAARVGDLTGRGPVTTPALDLLAAGNTADPARFTQATGIRPRTLAEGFAQMPSQTQDRWHARLYFVRPLLRLALAFLWLASGAAGLAPGVVAAWSGQAAALGLGPETMAALLYAACAVDLALGSALFFGWRVRLAAALSLAVIAAYTLLATIVQPGLWLDPFGPLVKNVPAFAATLAFLAIADER